MNRYLKNLCELAGFNKPITRTCYRAGQRVEETFFNRALDIPMNFIKFVPGFPNFIGKSDLTSINSNERCISEYST